MKDTDNVKSLDYMLSFQTLTADKNESLKELKNTRYPHDFPKSLSDYHQSLMIRILNEKYSASNALKAAKDIIYSIQGLDPNLVKVSSQKAIETFNAGEPKFKSCEKLKKNIKEINKLPENVLIKTAYLSEKKMNSLMSIQSINNLSDVINNNKIVLENSDKINDILDFFIHVSNKLSEEKNLSHKDKAIKEIFDKGLQNFVSAIQNQKNPIESFKECFTKLNNAEVEKSIIGKHTNIWKKIKTFFGIEKDTKSIQYYKKALQELENQLKAPQNEVTSKQNSENSSRDTPSRPGFH